MTEDTQALSIRLSRDLYERLRKAAFDHREPMNSIIARGTETELSRLRMRGKEIRHKDGNPCNNDPANLRIVDPKENER